MNKELMVKIAKWALKQPKNEIKIEDPNRVYDEIEPGLTGMQLIGYMKQMEPTCFTPATTMGLAGAKFIRDRPQLSVIVRDNENYPSDNPSTSSNVTINNVVNNNWLTNWFHNIRWGSVFRFFSKSNNESP